MPQDNAIVKFDFGSLAEYNNLSVKDPNTWYIITDPGNEAIYIGEVKYTSGGQPGGAGIKGIRVNRVPMAPDQDGIVDVWTPVVDGDMSEPIIIIESDDQSSSMQLTPNDVGAQLDIETPGGFASKNLTDKEYVDTAIAKIPAMGQTEDGGLYYPNSIKPSFVGAGAMLFTDGAKNIKTTSRTFCIMAGANLTCRSAPAGSTQYRVSNTRANRFTCLAALAPGTRLAVNRDAASTTGTVKIASIRYTDGSQLVPDFGPTDNSKDIVITVETSANPSSSTTSLRIYGTTVADDVVAIGQNVTAHSKGISIGISCRTDKQQTIAAGNSVLVTNTNSFGFGHLIYIPTMYSFATGYLHDLMGASHGTSAFGIASDIKSDTVMAVGNGQLYGDTVLRSNAFEVKRSGEAIVRSLQVTSNNGIILTSPNGTKYRLTVADDGTLSTTPA